MRVFITGIAGFIGSHIAEACIARGDTVAGNDSLICGDRNNVPARASFKSFACQNGPRLGTFKSVLDEFKPDVLIHCAATAHEGLSTFSPHFVTQNIFEASLATFSAAIASGVKRIVFLSSMARYGELDPPFTEDMACRPSDCYGIAKLAAEECLKNLCNTHGVKWSICTPHSVIGVRQNYQDPMRNVASIFINRCLRGDVPIIYGDGKQKRSFSPIKDCLPSFMKIIDGKADSQIVNIGPDKNEITINELAEKVMRLTGLNGKPQYMEARPNEVKFAYCSSDKARKLLGFKERQSIDECLKEMVEYVRKQKPKPFRWNMPIEIDSPLCPKTWKLRLM